MRDYPEPSLEVCEDCGDEFWFVPDGDNVCRKCAKAAAIGRDLMLRGTTITDLLEMNDRLFNAHQANCANPPQQYMDHICRRKA